MVSYKEAIPAIAEPVVTESDGKEKNMTSPQRSSQLQRRVKSSLSLPTRIDYLEPLQDYVRGLCQIHGCERKDASLVALAVEEAVSNVIQHGYASDEEGVFEVSFDVGAAGLTIEIREKGLPFDPKKLASYGEREFREASDETCGMGIRLMKGAMDRVEFLNLGKKGKLVRMSKYFRHGRVDRFFSREELQREHVSGDVPLGPFEIRPLKADEALEVSRCAYRAYGYTYREFIYYPERVWDLNEDGHLHSFVAVDGEGRLVGHLALSFSDTGAAIAELAAAFVNPSCRGQGLLGRLTCKVMGEAEKMGLQGLFVHAVTSHPASQKGAARSGFVPTGLLLAALFADLEFKSLTGRVGQKENALLMVKPLRERPRFDVWVPPRYAEMICFLAGEIGREVVVHEDRLPLREVSGGEGNRYYRVEEFNFAEIRIVTFGEDVFQELRYRLGGFIRERVDVVYLYLDMECPQAGAFAARCLDLGFCFCGYMPGEMAGKDALILQKLNNLTIDFSGISLADERAVEIMKFIEGEMPGSEEE